MFLPHRHNHHLEALSCMYQPQSGINIIEAEQAPHLKVIFFIVYYSYQIKVDMQKEDLKVWQVYQVVIYFIAQQTFI